MIRTDNKDKIHKADLSYETSLAKEIGISEEDYNSRWDADTPLHDILGYTAAEWRVKFQVDMRGTEMWENSAFESEWSELED